MLTIRDGFYCRSRITFCSKIGDVDIFLLCIDRINGKAIAGDVIFLPLDITIRIVLQIGRKRIGQQHDLFGRCSVVTWNLKVSGRMGMTSHVADKFSRHIRKISLYRQCLIGSCIGFVRLLPRFFLSKSIDNILNQTSSIQMGTLTHIVT